MNALLGQVQRNLSVHEAYIRAAAEQGADLVCFPELSVCGHWVHEDRVQAAEPLDGSPSVHYLGELCRQKNLYVSAGIIEKEGPAVYNTQVLIGPKGLIGSQRKLHASRDEYFYYRRGDTIEILDAGFAKIGIVICFDNMFPEVQRILGVKGAEIVLMPHAARCGPDWPLDANQKARVHEDQRRLVERVYTTRCRDNAQFGLYCNQAGPAGEGVNHAGGLAVLSPAGEVLAEAGYESFEDTMLVFELKSRILQDVRKSCCLPLLVRRPELYGDLSRM